MRQLCRRGITGSALCPLSGVEPPFKIFGHSLTSRIAGWHTPAFVTDSKQEVMKGLTGMFRWRRERLRNDPQGCSVSLRSSRASDRLPFRLQIIGHLLRLQSPCDISAVPKTEDDRSTRKLPLAKWNG